MLSINSSTAVLTDTSGYHLNATVTNTTGQEIPAGTLTLAMNAFYTFVSRNDIQDWSEGNGRIPTPQSVGQADVPALQPGASANVSIDADAHQESLAAINSWGPKPVLLSYSANGTPLAQSHTFVTRTGAGLHTPSTPALHITVAQPLAANGWTTDSKLLGQLVDEGGISSSKLAKIAMPSKDDDARLKSLQQTFAKHDMLQVVGDPTYLQAHYEEMYAPFTQTLSGMFTADWYFEYTAPGIDKARALEGALPKLGIDASEVVSFGDGQNDKSMIEWAGTGVAMGNAVDEVKAVAQMVTANNNEDGIAVALDKLLG